MGAEFVPGEWWTSERAATAVRRVADAMASPEMQALMQAVAEAGDDPAAAAAQMAPSAPPVRAIAPVDHAACTFRRGQPGDEPRFAELIIAGELPPLFITEWVEGFVAVEHGGEIIGCGGLEIYGDCGVLRSIVMDERARNMRLGERMAKLLMDDARAAGLTDLYLFTMHAAPFWRRLGYVELTLDQWKAPVRASWQYEFISQHPEAAGDVLRMWRPANSPA
jgi:N-acetylglutamate synthase-like GNAT family acetyltransferase